MLKSEKAEFFWDASFLLSYLQRGIACCLSFGLLRSRDQDGIRYARGGLGAFQWRQKRALAHDDDLTPGKARRKEERGLDRESLRLQQF